MRNNYRVFRVFYTIHWQTSWGQVIISPGSDDIKGRTESEVRTKFYRKRPHGTGLISLECVHERHQHDHWEPPLHDDMRRMHGPATAS